jgi:formamidopyrimidine-DNA glycosylase
LPELPEVETVRAGLSRFVVGRTVRRVEVRHPRSIRRHTAGAEDFVARLQGATITAARRRGKYLWLPFGPDVDCVSAHLGMSGQLLVQDERQPDEKHLHIRLRFTDGGPELRFIDQRTFGGMTIDELLAPADAADPVGDDLVPAAIRHIARDPIDPAFDDAGFVRRLRTRHSALKRALLDQTLISGIGNIYADESLWRARINGERLADTLTRPSAVALLGHVRAVLGEALEAGGTSFDALYVNVNGQSGYFDRALNAYGREDDPCPRCGTPIRRVAFMNRSSFYCPRCQRRPRTSSVPSVRSVAFGRQS